MLDRFTGTDPTVPGMPPRPDTLLNCILTALYAAVVYAILRRDTLWFDEAQEWLIAYASHSLPALYQNRRYEGHPVYWYVLVWGFQHIFPSFASLKILSFLFAVAACWITLTRMPLTRIQKVLFPFGAYFIFILSCQARPYMAAYILLVLACHYTARKRMGPAFACLAAAGSLHIFILPIAGMMMIKYMVDNELLSGRFPFMTIRHAGIAMLALAVLALSLFQEIPPPGSPAFTTANYVFEPGKILRFLSQAVIPGSVGRLAYSIQPGPVGIPLAGITGAIVLSTGYLAFRSRIGTGLFYAVSAMFLLLYQSFGYGGTPWHLGLIYIVVLLTLFSISLECDAAKTRLPASCLLTGLMIVQLVSTAIVAKEIVTKKSMGMDAAAFLKDYCQPVRCTLVSDLDSTMVTASAYMNGVSFYSTNRGAFGTFVVWDGHRHLPHSVAATARAAHGFPNPVMIFDAPVPDDAAIDNSLQPMASFSGAEATFENMYLYRFSETR